MAKKQPARRKLARKRTTKARARSRARKAVPPPDNPLLRHEELSVDRRIEGETAVVDSPSLVAAMAADTGQRRRGGARATGRRSSTVKKLCQFRLSALVESRGLPTQDPGPTRARTRVLSARAPGVVELVAPVAGTSNWVQLGPTAIPNGQTY